MSRRLGSGITLTGAKELRGSLTKHRQIVQHEGMAGLRLLAKQVMLGSQDRAPEKSGDLVNSHRIVEDSNGFAVVVGPTFNEKGQDYSLDMHEGINGLKYNLGERSEAKNLGTPHFGIGVGWKFLERSLRETTRTAMKDLARFMQRAFK